MIQASGLTSGRRPPGRDHADFTVAAGKVTGFLGPNGAGKSHDDADDLGLDRPTAAGSRSRKATAS